jgi:abortive infection bacteriophage resistance protein
MESYQKWLKKLNMMINIVAHHRKAEKRHLMVDGR